MQIRSHLAPKLSTIRIIRERALVEVDSRQMAERIRIRRIRIARSVSTTSNLI